MARASFCLPAPAPSRTESILGLLRLRPIMATTRMTPTELSPLVTKEGGGNGGVHAEEKGASLASSIVNLANTIIGAGLLTLPFAMKVSGGVIPFALLFLSVSVGSAYGFRLLCRCCELTGKYTYRELGDAALPGRGWLIEAAKGAYTTGTCIAYMVLIADFSTLLADDVFPRDNHSSVMRTLHSIFANRATATIVLAVLCCFPLSLLRSLNALRFSSLVSIACISYTVLAVFGTYAFKYDFKVNDTVKLISVSPAVLGALPLMSVSMTGHYNAPTFYRELRNRSEARFGVVVNCALMICLIAYAIMATSGYLCFGSTVQGDILNNLVVGSGVAIIARLALLITIITSYPLVFNSMRSAARELLESASGSRSGAEMTTIGALAYSIVFVTLHVVIALLVPQVEVVLGYNGSVFGTSIVYIMPAVMCIKLSSSSSSSRSRSSSSSSIGTRTDTTGEIDTEKALLLQDQTTDTTTPQISPLPLRSSIALIVFGAVMMIGGCVSTAINAAGPTNG